MSENEIIKSNHEKINFEKIDEDIYQLSFNSQDATEEEHDEMAAETKRLSNLIHQQFPGKALRVLIDLTNGGVPPERARKVYVQTLADKEFDRVAIYGIGSALTSVVDFIVSASGKGDKVHFFVDRDRAIAWLKE